MTRGAQFPIDDYADELGELLALNDRVQAVQILRT